ncbi:MAG TPA: zf-HC2 domain-containing protein [Ktedonobacterales bacterium]|jgi:hypothetical protein
MKTSVPHPCPAWAEKLAAVHSNDLSPEERTALEVHVASCEQCRAAQERYAQMDAAILRLPAPVLPELPAKVLAQWAAEDRAARRSGVVRPLRSQEQPLLRDTPTLPDGPIAPSRPERRPPRRPFSLLTAIAAVLLVALLTTALIASRLHFGPPSGGPGPQNTTPPTGITVIATQGTAVISPSPTPTSHPVKVYFSHNPESYNDPSFVQAVQRISPDAGVATFALKQLFLGPTADEQAQGYFSEFVGNLGNDNVCSDTSKVFTLSLDHRGTTPETGTATVMLCVSVTIPGDLSGFRMQAMITATLTQFPNTKKVVILNNQGNCFNDLRGGNNCLQG